MRKLLNKEIRLAASPLSYWFLAAGLMTLLPGYPILVGAFFVCQGLFQSYQTMRENNDVVYSVLLPVSKADTVKGKFLFALFIEALGFAIMLALTLLRMTVMKDAAVYRSNPLMTANLCFLGAALIIFSLFNLVFIRGFFKTAFYFAKPFITFIILCGVVIIAEEILPHIPGCEWIGSFGFDNIGGQLIYFVICALLSAVMNIIAYKGSKASFEKIDL